MWHDYFNNILNSTVNSKINKFDNVNFEHITPSEIKVAIKRLKKGTSAGSDNLTSEHFIHAHDNVCVLLSLLFNSMLCHNYIPLKFMDTVIIPILKDSKGDITDCNNYRPIAITCTMSKILESVILLKYHDYLFSTDNQFGFKPNHSTDYCIFILKEVIDFYTSHNSPVYICFMDASKAFDRVSHYCLFKKLLDRGLPSIIVRLLSTWYSTQTFVVKWCNQSSKPFNVSNGVRQGGILSPTLFNIYMDDLSKKLAHLGVGCKINNVSVNHLFYADDTVLMAPSPTALQRLISTCEIYGKCNEIIYNTSKTVCMSFLTKSLLKFSIPSIYINGCQLQQVHEYKYLGVYITSNKNDSRDLQRQLRYIYSKGNMLVRKFGKCSEEVKRQLFRSYCYNMYCAHLWSNYPEAKLRNVKVAYNNVFRSFFNIRRSCSVSKFYVNFNIDGFNVLKRKSIVNFRSRLLSSSNNILSIIVNSFYFNRSSQLYNTWCKQIF
jgi:hypothetical protein